MAAYLQTSDCKLHSLWSHGVMDLRLSIAMIALVADYPCLGELEALLYWQASFVPRMEYPCRAAFLGGLLQDRVKLTTSGLYQTRNKYRNTHWTAVCLGAPSMQGSQHFIAKRNLCSPGCFAFGRPAIGCRWGPLPLVPCFLPKAYAVASGSGVGISIPELDSVLELLRDFAFEPELSFQRLAR